MLQDASEIDFGKEVIPRAIHTQRVHAHFFAGYWEDIGTIRTFYAANLDVASAHPSIDLFSEHAPIYTRPRFLPPTRMGEVKLVESIACEGCRIEEAEIDHSIVGIRSIIGRGVRLSHSIMMGADLYAADQDRPGSDNVIPVGIGSGSTIERAIIDKNARIGEGVTIRGPEHHGPIDGPGYYIRDGIVIVPKNGVIPPGTVI